MIGLVKFSLVVNGEKVTRDVLYECPEGSNLRQRIHDAALDYYLASQKNGEATTITYADFVYNTPNEFCERYGFRKTLVRSDLPIIIGNSIVVDEMEIKRHLEDAAKADIRENALRKLIHALGEKIEPMISNTIMTGEKFTQITDQMLQCAQEYAQSCDGKDISGDQLDDFNKNVAQLLDTENLEPPDAQNGDEAIEDEVAEDEIKD